MSKTPVRMRMSSIDRKGEQAMEILPIAHACLPFIYVDKECFVFVVDEPQLCGINHNFVE